MLDVQKEIDRITVNEDYKGTFYVQGSWDFHSIRYV